MNFRFTSSCPHWRKFYMQIIFRIHSTVMTYPEMVDLTQTSHPLAHLLVGFLALNITRWPKFDMNFAKFGDSYSKHIQFHRSFVTCSEESHYHQRPFNGGPIYCCFFSFLFFFCRTDKRRWCWRTPTRRTCSGSRTSGAAWKWSSTRCTTNCTSTARRPSPTSWPSWPRPTPLRWPCPSWPPPTRPAPVGPVGPVVPAAPAEGAGQRRYAIFLVLRFFWSFLKKIIGSHFLKDVPLDRQINLKMLM